MNREQRRKFKKLQPKADEIWKLEMLAVLAKEPSVKAQIERDIAKIASTCNPYELFLIDEYLHEQYGTPT